jgi:hypothetical protein
MLNLHQAIRVSVLVALSAVLSFAQFESGSVLGTITDAGDQVVASASVTLTNVRTGTSLKAETDNSGNFLFVNQRLGSYRVRAEKQGFKTAETGEFELAVDARQRVNLRLEVGAVSDSIMVTDAAGVLESDNSSRGQVINPAQIRRIQMRDAIRC